MRRRCTPSRCARAAFGRAILPLVRRSCTQRQKRACLIAGPASSLPSKNKMLELWSATTHSAVAGGAAFGRAVVCLVDAPISHRLQAEGRARDHPHNKDDLQTTHKRRMVIPARNAALADVDDVPFDTAARTNDMTTANMAATRRVATACEPELSPSS
ncbi:hypothetical protein BD626DRAFT_471893 [Schizophyllum amplum]|uniref:Uncharacterized protein n=1 Tax=Schizophyllum amplum TaxID=97359 RepID=A0A550CVJ2_9AGAR|nr:hypothetical protein BD626DRAFT_471893 [Auriculariopsis ampla]